MDTEETPLRTLYIDESAGATQLAAVERVKKTRSDAQVRRALDRLQAAAESNENVMPPILDAVRTYATIGEMCDVLRAVWGEYEEVAVI